MRPQPVPRRSKLLQSLHQGSAWLKLVQSYWLQPELQTEAAVPAETTVAPVKAEAIRGTCRPESGEESDPVPPSNTPHPALDDGLFVWDVRSHPLRGRGGGCMCGYVCVRGLLSQHSV